MLGTPGENASSEFKQEVEAQRIATSARLRVLEAQTAFDTAVYRKLVSADRGKKEVREAKKRLVKARRHLRVADRKATVAHRAWLHHVVSNARPSTSHAGVEQLSFGDSVEEVEAFMSTAARIQLTDFQSPPASSQGIENDHSQTQLQPLALEARKRQQLRCWEGHRIVFTGGRSGGVHDCARFGASLTTAKALFHKTPGAFALEYCVKQGIARIWTSDTSGKTSAHNLVPTAGWDTYRVVKPWR